MNLASVLVILAFGAIALLLLVGLLGAWKRIKDLSSRLAAVENHDDPSQVTLADIAALTETDAKLADLLGCRGQQIQRVEDYIGLKPLGRAGETPRSPGSTSP
jgi:HAMP domain-containing protein